MFFKGIACNAKTVSFNRELKAAELGALRELLLDFLKNEPAYEALATIEQTKAIKELYNLKDDKDLSRKTTLLKKLFAYFKNDLALLGYIHLREGSYRILTKPL